MQFSLSDFRELFAEVLQVEALDLNNRELGKLLGALNANAEFSNTWVIRRAGRPHAPLRYYAIIACNSALLSTHARRAVSVCRPRDGPERDQTQGEGGGADTR